MLTAPHTQLLPRDGVPLKEVVRVLREVHANLINMPGRAHGGVTLLDLYLEWAEDSVRMLREAIRAEDVDRLVLTRRYWAIQATPTGSWIRVVRTELDERSDELARTIAALERTMQKWSVTAGRLMVADTTLFCQHPDKLREVDFAAILQCRDTPVRLMVPILVLDELEGLKQSNKAHIRWRAGYTLAVLDEVLGADGTGMLKDEDYSGLDKGVIPRGRVDVEIYFDPAGHRRVPINDDELIDRARAVSWEAGKRVTFVTYDTAQSTRAKFAGLEVVKLRQEPTPEPAG